MKRNFHPFLFATYPILFLYARNMEEFTPDVMVAPLLISLALTVLLFFALYRFSKNPTRNIFLLSLFLIFFYSYGHFYHLLEQTRLLRIGILGDQKFVLTIFGILFVIFAFLSSKKIRNWESATTFLNVFGGFLCLVALIQIGAYVVRNPPKTHEQAPESITHNASAALPDIFYIILDGYPRQDVLSEVHHFDNSNFLEFLTSKGFLVLQHAHSNYPGTALSLSSSLNFNYLSEMIPEKESQSGNRWLLTDLIQKNRILETLKSHGYVTAAFDSGYFPTELKHVDHFYATGWFLNEFHDALVDTTPAWALFKNLGRYEMQRKRILYIFDHLAEVKDPSKPVFVFGHIMALHPPFVFGPNGEPKNPRGSSLEFWKDFGGPSSKELSLQYQDQLAFVNKKTEEMVKNILAYRSRPTLIILQGDHGSSFLSPRKDGERKFYKERFSILNAIRIPDEGTKTQIYDSMTPVNTFRVVSNSYLGAKLDLLPDRSYFSERETPYDLVDVTDKIER